MLNQTTIKAVKLADRVNKDIANRSTQTLSVREQVFSAIEVTREYFAQHGGDGVKQLLISINSVADANQLATLNVLTPERAIAMLIASQTLIATSGASTGEGELSEVESILAHSLYYSELLNNHADTPYSQTPKYPLVLDMVTGEVTVLDPPPIEEDPED